jgi:16S rRNA (guanine(966)-N(2))-methyltransferase RsmD
MRIIAGKVGGHSLETPRDRSIRPTPDRVRESLFNILGNIKDAVAVDGFAGTGACGLEALSRGASHCYFIDSSEQAFELIRQNLQATGLDDQGIVLRGTFRSQIKLIDETPDLWFLDPPFEEDLVEDTLKAMTLSSAVTERALAVVKQDKRDDIEEVRPFEIEDNRVYGRNRLLFYRYLPDESPKDT